jgi:peptidoglycan/xylan/chitin deacetylase (PgdA/CDA1 family)
MTLGLAIHAPSAADEGAGVPILVYHRFGAAVVDSMTITTSVFESQMEWLKAHDYKVIPLGTLIDHLTGQAPPPPPRSVVITADDGHRSVYSDMLPAVKRHRIPVTLFVYPSAISNASYAMTWEQLKELHQTGLFSIQSHSFWHPNFKKEKARLSPDAYGKLVDSQLQNSRNVLEKRFGDKVDLLAWPFGIFDEALEKDAARVGYRAAFSIERKHASRSGSVMSLPRYLVVNGDGVKGFEAIVTGRSAGQGPTTY